MACFVLSCKPDLLAHHFVACTSGLGPRFVTSPSGCSVARIGFVSGREFGGDVFTLAVFAMRFVIVQAERELAISVIWWELFFKVHRLAFLFGGRFALASVVRLLAFDRVTTQMEKFHAELKAFDARGLSPSVWGAQPLPCLS